MEHVTNGTKPAPARKPARKATAHKGTVYAQRPRSQAEEFLMLAIALQSATHRLRVARHEVRAYEAEMSAILKAENDRLDVERTVAF